MQKNKLSLQSGFEFQTYNWLPKKINAIVIIVHGMADHAQRYDHFANYLNKNNIAVYAFDLPGHGLTAKTKEDLGFFAKTKGWELAVSCLEKFAKEINKKHESTPIIMVSHSMGTIISQTYLQKKPIKLKGAVFINNPLNRKIKNIAILLTARALSTIKSGKKPCIFIERNTFGQYAKKMNNAKTDLDWISSDENEVKKYINDPYCGFVCSCTMYTDLTKALLKTYKKTSLKKVPKEIPFIFLSGSDCPVSKGGKYPAIIKKRFNEIGKNNIQTKIFKGCRHELLNEKNKKEIYDYILNWIEKKI